MMGAIQTIRSPWDSRFYEIVGGARENLLVVSLFIKHIQAREIINRLVNAGVSTSIQMNVMTDLKPENILAGALDVEALLAFTDFVPKSSITYLPNLHAKVYVADRSAAIITSANLTNGGLTRNFEYGVVLTDPLIVAQVSQDLNEYALLGSNVSKQSLKTLASATSELRELRQKAEKSIRKKFKNELANKLEAANL